MLANKLMLALSGGAEDKLYVDDVFSTYPYTGNGTAQTFNNGIDLAGKGGLVWIKRRDSGRSHRLIDTQRGIGKYLATDTTATEVSNSPRLTSFNAGGFTLTPGYSPETNDGATYVSWTFRKSPKFFDVVTYTGNGVAGRQIPHALGIAPGMVVVKCTSLAENWIVWHRGLKSVTATDNSLIYLNQTNGASGAGSSTTYWNNNAPTAEVLYLGDNNVVNANGAQYVAYLFAHDPSADGIIQCGSFTTDASGYATVNLGWEPQYVLLKSASTTGNWLVTDISRGMPVGTVAALDGERLYLNSSIAGDGYSIAGPTATGFTTKAGSIATSSTVIYLAIRRPNKPPTTGTEVYNAIARTGTGAAATVTGVGFAPDLVISSTTNNNGNVGKFYDRLRGNILELTSSSTASEATSLAYPDFGALMDGIGVVGNNSRFNGSGIPYINHFFKRAPGFFDVVCYTGTDAARTVPHSLGVAPELMIVKKRNGGVSGWFVGTNFSASNLNIGYLNNTTGYGVRTYTEGHLANRPTVTGLLLGTNGDVNSGGLSYVAYLFASLPGISKVGSYTGNGTTQTINCGFTTGARFILIKRTDSTGDWYIWDTARGIVSANDPHLSLNTTAAEVTTDDSVDPDASGFVVNQVAATNINVSAASYIFLAIA